MLIRVPAADELPILRAIERDAGASFRDIGMAEVADDEPPAIDELTRRLHEGLAWVATNRPDEPIAYLIADIVDDNLHIEQVSVRPENARQGVGRALIEHVAEHARADGRRALTLTTFADVPWNAPYYERCGFHRLAESAMSPGLREIRRREAALGLDRWPRVCMRRDL